MFIDSALKVEIKYLLKKALCISFIVGVKETICCGLFMEMNPYEDTFLYCYSSLSP